MYSALVASITAVAVLSGLADAVSIPQRRSRSNNLEERLLGGLGGLLGGSTPTLPAAGSTNSGWLNIGCYLDTSVRLLGGMNVQGSSSMTIENCIAFCDKNNYFLAGVE